MSSTGLSYSEKGRHSLERRTLLLRTFLGTSTATGLWGEKKKNEEVSVKVLNQHGYIYLAYLLISMFPVLKLSGSPLYWCLFLTLIFQLSLHPLFCDCFFIRKCEGHSLHYIEMGFPIVRHLGTP
jgi:hypothetical protein